MKGATIIKCLIGLLIILVLLMLIQISITLKEIQEENSLRVTEIHHHYEYTVESYGPVQLNDRLVEFTTKPLK